MASQEKQVLYVSDPCDNGWSLVLQGKQQFLGDESHEQEVFEINAFSRGILSLPIKDSDNVQTIICRYDHGEGIWVNEDANTKRKLQ